MSVRKQAIWAFATLCVLSALVLFWGLPTGSMKIYDEGLYGMYGRTMLRFGTLLHVVDTQGEFPTGAVKFSKPPLSVWAVAASMYALGPSLFALRLPFALASLVVTLVSFAFGPLLERSARGVWLGFAWGIAWLIAFGTYEHGRTATIEPMLLAFVITALYAYARALGASSTARALGWAALAGAAISGAFFTKQLVCAIAALPILVTERLVRRDAPRGRRWGRLTVALGVPALLAGAWLAALYAKVGESTFKVLWSHAIVRRVSGFDGMHHQNYLNRVADLLESDSKPFSWQLGLLGLGLLWFEKTRVREAGPRHERGAAWLIALWFFCSWLAFDVGSRAILPWYALTLLPPLALGNAWLVVRAVDYVRSPTGGRLEGLIAASGAIVLALAATRSAHAFMPSMLALALALAALLYCARQPPPSAARLSLVLAAVGGVLAFGTFQRDAYRGTDTDPQASLGHELWQRGKARVSIAGSAEVHPYARTTFFGPRAKQDDTPPWRDGADEGRRWDAHVEALTWPLEVPPRAGVELLRDAGLLAWVGDLSQPPVGPTALRGALDKGSLTFEAEHMASERFYTLATAPDASGGRVRRSDQRLLERAAEFVLARGRTPELPRGRYVASFWLQLRCTGYRGESLGDARVVAKRAHAKRKVLDCRTARKQTPEAFHAVEVPFTLSGDSAVDLELRASQGEVTLDRVTIRRDAR